MVTVSAFACLHEEAGCNTVEYAPGTERAAYHRTGGPADGTSASAVSERGIHPGHHPISPRFYTIWPCQCSIQFNLFDDFEHRGIC